MAEDNGSALFQKCKSEDTELPIAKKTSKNELFVSPGNALSKQMLEPFGMNELDTISLGQLWKKAGRGHEHCAQFTEYAISNDKNYKGLALSKSIKSRGPAVKNATDEQEVGQVLDKNDAIEAESEDDMVD